MEANNRNRTLALAAIFQAIEGVIQIARNGKVDEALLKSALNSLLVDQSDSIEDLYGGLEELRPGLRSLVYQINGSPIMPDGKPKDLDATRYSVNVLYLERKLSQDNAMFRQLIQGIEDTQKQLEFFEINHPNVCARLAELYTKTISKLGPRIIIKGEQSYLSSPENAAKIRVLLLAGIRAALLWRQSGGNRWKLLLSRGKLQKEARTLLRSLPNDAPAPDEND